MKIAKTLVAVALLAVGLFVLAGIAQAGMMKCGSFINFLEEPIRCSSGRMHPVFWLFGGFMLLLGGGLLWEVRRSGTRQPKV